MVDHSLRTPAPSRARKRSGRQTSDGGLAVPALVALCLALLAYVVTTANGNHNLEAQPLLAGAIFFFAFVMIRGIMAAGGLFCTTYGIYYILFLTLPGMFNISTDEFPFFGMRYVEADIYQAATVVFVFSIAGFFGHLLASTTRSPAPITVPEPESRKTANLALIIGFVALSVFLIALAGPRVFLAKRNELVVVDFGAGSQIVQIVVQTARTSAVIALIAAVHRWLTYKRGVVDLIPVMMCLALNGIANFPLGIARFNLFAYLLIIMQMVFDVTRPRFKTVFVVGLFAGMTTIFPYTAFLQRGQEGTTFEFDVVGYLKSANDLDGFQSIINVVALVSGEGLSKGWQLLSTLLAPVPRAFWPDKGLPTGSIAAAYMGYPMVNISAPLPSEFLVDFGMVGVFLGGIIVAFALTRLDVIYKISPNRGSLRFYLVHGGIVSYLIILSRGPLLGVIAPIALFFGLSFFATMKRFSQDVGGSTAPPPPVAPMKRWRAGARR